MDKPFAQSCENNKNAILEQLKSEMVNVRTVLEIASGTGQHAVHFAQQLPHLTWQTSDLAITHEGINAWINESKLTNVSLPLEIDLALPWDHVTGDIDAIFTSNIIHYVDWAFVENFFESAGKLLSKNGKLCIYGPFKYDGQFTTPSNAEFDLWLKSGDAQRGVRDIEKVSELARQNGLSLEGDYDMPANNRFLVFIKK